MYKSSNRQPAVTEGSGCSNCSAAYRPLQQRRLQQHWRRQLQSRSSSSCWCCLGCRCRRGYYHRTTRYDENQCCIRFCRHLCTSRLPTARLPFVLLRLSQASYTAALSGSSGLTAAPASLWCLVHAARRTPYVATGNSRRTSRGRCCEAILSSSSTSRCRSLCKSVRLSACWSISPPLVGWLVGSFVVASFFTRQPGLASDCLSPSSTTRGARECRVSAFDTRWVDGPEFCCVVAADTHAFGWWQVTYPTGRCPHP
jgi:hypothetical protein